MTLSALRCACGSPEIMAVAPGTEPDGAAKPDLFTAYAANADRGSPVRAFCWPCWAARFTGGGQDAPGTTTA